MGQEGRRGEGRGRHMPCHVRTGRHFGPPHPPTPRPSPASPPPSRTSQIRVALSWRRCWGSRRWPRQSPPPRDHQSPALSRRGGGGFRGEEEALADDGRGKATIRALHSAGGKEEGGRSVLTEQGSRIRVRRHPSTPQPLQTSSSAAPHFLRPSPPTHFKSPLPPPTP